MATAGDIPESLAFLTSLPLADHIVHAVSCQQTGTCCMSATTGASHGSFPASIADRLCCRKTEVYEMLWRDVQLDKQIVCGAPFGGPIGEPACRFCERVAHVRAWHSAMVRDDRKVLLIGAEADRPKMRIYTSAGSLISSFPVRASFASSSLTLRMQWTHRGLVTMGWTDKDNLACVLE